MSPRSKQLIGNALSVLGVVPLCAWQAGLVLISYRVGMPEEVTFGLTDAMLLLAVGGLAYMVALLFAVPACMFTMRLLRLNPKLPKGFTKGSCVVVALLMAAPLVVAGVKYLRF